jgi:hypothetical protein
MILKWGILKKLETLEIKNEQNLIKKNLSEKEVFQRKLKAMLNLRSAEIKISNNPNSKRLEITIKE